MENPPPDRCKYGIGCAGRHQLNLSVESDEVPTEVNDGVHSRAVDRGGVDELERVAPERGVVDPVESSREDGVNTFIGAILDRGPPSHVSLTDERLRGEPASFPTN